MKKLLNKAKQLLFSPIVAILITIIASLYLLQNHRRLDRLELSRKNIQSTEQTVQSLQESIGEVDLELEQAQQPLAKEKIIRDELLHQKENELVLKLPEIKIEEQEQELVLEQSNWEAWMEVVGRE